MSQNITTGDESPKSFRRDEPDAHGQAALLLAESTLYALIDAGMLTPEQAIDAVRTAAQVKVDIADETGESDSRMQHSLNLLTAIERSLEID